jgi:hypothetical protein
MKHPDREDTLALLGEWAKHHAAVEDLMDGVESSIGLDPNGPMFETVWKLFDAYTATLSVEIGDFDGWLEWHRADNDMGAGKKTAGYDGQLIAIASLEDLYLLIEISRERNQ